MKTAAIVLTALAVTGALAWTPAQAQAGNGGPRSVSRAVHRIHVAALPVGPGPKIDYLAGRQLHTASGETVTVDAPLPGRDSLQLLGASADGGWVVVDRLSQQILDVAPSGATRVIAVPESTEVPSTFYLSTNGALVAIQTNDQEDSSAVIQVVDLSGATVGRHSWLDAGKVVGFVGRRLYFTQFGGNDASNPTFAWRMGRKPHVSGIRGGELVDAEHAQAVRLVTTEDQYRYGVVSLSQPSQVRWEYCYSCRIGSQATAFSPSGTRIVLERWVGDKATHDLSVRSAVSGAHRSGLDLSMPVVAERWDSDHALVVEVRRGPARTGKHALVRCTLGGVCARVSPWQRHWLLTWSSEQIRRPVTRPSTTHLIKVHTLTRGSHARIDYLTGRLLHTAAGGQILIDVPKRYQNSLELLGRSARGGWILGYHHLSEVLALAPTGQVRVITRYHEPEEGDSRLRLSSNGQLVAIESYGHGSARERVRVFDLAGREVGHHTWAASGRTLAFDGRTLWFSEASTLKRLDLRLGPLWRWRLGSAPHRTDLQGVDFLDPQHREATRILQLVPAQHDAVVSMDDPATVRWPFCQGCRHSYTPTAFSPDGSRLLLERGGNHEQREVSIRSSEDGTTVSDLLFSWPESGEMWQDDHHVLVAILAPDHERDLYGLVRCSVKGACVRVTDWQSHPIWNYFVD
jgi:hypothetical protein